MHKRRGASLFVLLVLISASAISDQRADFKQAYERYQSAIASGDRDAAVAASEDAYRLGLKIYGKDSISYARLALNYAGLLNDTGEYRDARRVLKKKIEAIERDGSADDLELVLYELGRAEFDPKRPDKGLDYFDRSVEAVPADDVGSRATRAFSIGTYLMKQQGDRHTKSYFEVAHTGFKALLQPNDLRLGLANYHLGLWAYREARIDDAVGLFEDALVAFATEAGPLTDFERPVRSLLISLFEAAGSSDQATPHVIALGRGQDWRQQQPDVLYMDTAPTMMMAKSGLRGDVQLTFRIDATGNVTDVGVSSSTNAELNELARTVISTARFAPRYQDSVAVETDGVTYTLTFDFTIPQSVKTLGGSPPVRGFYDGGVSQTPQGADRSSGMGGK
ncbi:MAG: TonB family protein [Pseudomonadota bacterium]